VATLKTPERLQNLQRALYLRAKKEPKFRAYALYDKVYRMDVLEHAYALAKANGGAPGPDGKTFEEIEATGRMALLEELKEELKTKKYRPGSVRRVYIPKLNGGERPLGIPDIRDRVVQTAAKLLLEPLFEADFEKDSYGFRPKKNAHQALEAIGEALNDGMRWVIDADVTTYFDSIPHDRLMKTVAERVVDGAMLALVKMFLEAPVIDERDGGGPRRNKTGTPQGGVISPLLANIYLHLLDRNFRRHVESGRLHGRLIRYADDFVLLSLGKPNAAMEWIQGFMSRLGLLLHPSKTRVLSAGEEDFDFLGHRVCWNRGRVHLDASAKAKGRIRDEIRRITRNTWLSVEELVHRLNLYIRGARQYFRNIRRRSLTTLDFFVGQRLARWSARKHGRRCPDWAFAHVLLREHRVEPLNLPKALRPLASRYAT
jgi:group II intron reverse transcriptase/maturase